MKNIARWTEHWGTGSGTEIEYHVETASTNSLGREKLFDEKRLILTEHQTNGRGRGTNKWLDSEPGSTLLSSWCFPMEHAMQPITSPLVGLALFEAASSVWPQLTWSLKAPNDLYIENKKVAGLLIENISMGKRHQLIIGLGFNVYSHPEIENACDLQELLRSPLTEDQWFRFLDLLWAGFLKILPEGLQKTLTPGHCNRLLKALNNSPQLISKYDEVLPDGSLRQGAVLRHWTVL